MRSYPLIVGLFVVLALLGAPARAADVRAWLDRDTMQLGETVTLNVEADGSVDGEPDFSPLRAEFELFGSSSSSSINIVNGTTAAKKLWAIGLQPRRAGAITLPAIAIGNLSTPALALTVTPAPASASSTAGDEVFIEAEAQPASPYVQQQVRYTVKLYYAVNLADGALDDPQVAGLVARKLGQDRSYQTERGGRRYNVLERRYALLPERSGTLSIPALNFRGRAIGGNDPGAMFFSRGRAVSARSPEVTLDVRPRPDGSGTAPWLPAQSLELHADGLDASTAAQVGEPVTVTITLRAQGVGFEQLPEIELPPIDGAEVYPDKSATQTRDDGNSLFGERTRKFAIVPTRAGKLVVPGVRVSWWDLSQDRAALAELPPHTIDVAAAASGASAPSIAVAPASATPPASAVTDSTATSAVAAFWRSTAIVVIALWLATLIVVAIAWRRRSDVPRATTVTAPPDGHGTRPAFARAVASGDAAAAAQALLRWGRAEGFAARNLGELADQLDDAAQRAAIERIQRAAYGDGDRRFASDAIAPAFARGLRRAQPRRDAEPAVLPPLYPPPVERI